MISHSPSWPMYEDTIRVARGVARRYFRLAWDQEEVAQDILLIIWKNKHTFDPTRGSWHSWAASIAHRHCINILRRPHISSCDPLELTTVVGPQVSGEYGRVPPSLSGLSEKEAEVVDLIVLRDLSYKQTSTHLHMPLGTVKSTMSRALQKLRRKAVVLGGSNGL